MYIKEFLDRPDVRDLIAADDLASVYSLLHETYRGQLSAYLLNLGITAETIVSYFGDTLIDGLFFGCNNLTSIDIPAGITTINRLVFATCYGLRSIVIPDSVKFFDTAAVANCPNLKDIYYMGSKEQWKQIDIRLNNGPLYIRKIHFAK